MPNLDQIPFSAIFVFFIVGAVLHWARKSYCPAAEGMKNELRIALTTLEKVEAPLKAGTFRDVLKPLFENKSPKLKGAWQEYCEMLDGQLDPDDNAKVYNFRQAELFINKESIFDASVNTELFHAVPGILTAIGLLGTFSALYVALAGLSFNPSHLPVFISQLSGKFLCSIIGVSGAIYFLYIERRSNGEISQSFLELQNRLNSLMTHKSSESMLKQLNTELSTLSTRIQEQQSSLSTAIPEAVRLGLQEALKGEVEKLREQTGSVLEEIRKSNTDNQKELKALTENFQGLISSTFNTVSKEAFNASKDQLQLLQVEVRNLTSAIAAANESAHAMNENITSATQGIGQALGELQTGSQNINDTVSSTLGHVRNDFQVISKSLNESSSNLKSGVDELGTKLESSIQLLNDGVLSATQSMNAGFNSSMNDMKAGFASSLNDMNSRFDIAGKTMEKGMSLATDEINRGFGSATDNLRDVLSKLNEQNDELLRLRTQMSQLIHSEMANTLKWHQEEIKALSNAQQQQYDAVIAGVKQVYENLLATSEKYYISNQQELASTFEKILSRVDFSNDNYANKLRSDVDYMVKSLGTWIETASGELNVLVTATAKETADIKNASQSVKDLLNSLQVAADKLNSMNTTLIPVVSEMGKAANSIQNAGNVFSTASQSFDTGLSNFRQACHEQSEMMTRLKDEIQFNALLGPVPSMVVDNHGGGMTIADVDGNGKD